VRRPLTVLVAAGVAVVVAIAVADALRGSSPNQDGEQTTQSRPPAATTSRPEVASALGRRSIRLEEVVGATWSEPVMLDPGEPLTVRVDLPSAAEVDVWFERFGSRIDVLDRSRRHACERQEDRELCLLRLPPSDDDSGVWLLLVRKLSAGSAVIRLSIAERVATGQD
jgi:hypothetical protein